MTVLKPFALNLHRHAVMRGLAGGCAWGITVAAALIALTFYQCGTICLGQIVDTTAMSIAAGMLTIGPLVTFRRETQAPAQ